MLFSLGILDRAKTWIFQQSEFPAENTDIHHSQIISDIKLAMQEGKTILLINTPNIHGSFYDLFNQHYK